MHLLNKSLSFLTQITLMVLFIAMPTTAYSQDTESAKDSAEVEKENELPLEAGRAFSFELNEGSWIALDVSPDGKTIVFDFLGDLYTIPINGGEAKQITKGMQFDSQPRFSPDGKKLVFISDASGGEGVWIYDLETEEKEQLTKGKDTEYQSPEWAPDGKYVIASKNDPGNHKIWLYHVDGGSGTELVDEPRNLRMLEGAFGDDERYIWFSQRSGTWNYNAILPQYQIATYDRKTGDITVQTDRYGSSFRPTLSSDGKWLVYGTRHEEQTGLVKQNLQTGDESWLAYPVQHDDQESRASRDVLPGMSFTPDNKHVVASYGGKIWKMPIDGGEATEIPFTVRSTIDLGPELQFSYPIEDTPKFEITQIRDAVPSPDGKTLAFTALNEVYTMELPDGEPKKLVDLNETQAQPVWSPDGKYIAFVSWTPESGKLYKVRANGRRLEQLNEEEGVFQDPVWNNDGSRIVVIKGDPQDFRNATRRSAFQGTSDLIWIDSDGSKNNFITYTNRRGNPHFVKGNDRIFLSGRNGLSSIRWDGTDEQFHLEVSRSGGGDADWIRMAPEGDQALAQVNSDLFVVTVPKVGGEAPSITVGGSSSAFPSNQLTDIGGQFPAWSWDAAKVHWSIGNTHVIYDFDKEEAFNDSLEAAEKAEEKEMKKAEASDADSDEEASDKEEDADKKEEFEPQEIKISVMAERDIPEGTLVLEGATLITMNDEEEEKVLKNATLVIVNNRIVNIGTVGEVEYPENAKIIDMEGKTILPGFVDTHAHFRHPVNIHRGEFWSYLTNLAFGVITTRDPQTATTDVLTYGDLVQAGKLLGPRVYSTGPGVFSSEDISDLDHARDVLKRYSKYYDTKTIKMYGAGNREQRQWIIQAAREQELMPTTEGALDFKENLTQVIDGYPGHEHSFPIYPLYEDVIDLVSFSNTAYTPTLLVAYGGPWAENYFYATERPHDNKKLQRFMPHSNLDSRTRRRGSGWFMEEEHVFEELAVFVKDLVEAGGRAGVGSHGQLQGLGYHWELWAMQAGGLSEYDALKVATIQGADAIGLSQDLGSIEVGKLADLVILNSDPLQNIRNTADISHIMKNGYLYEADTLNELFPNQKELGSFWWQDYEPKNVPGIKK